MELPQSQPYGDEGRNPNRDFLSLYSVSSFQRQDPTPSQGFYLQTHDFLQPLELAGKNDSNKKAREMPAGEMPSSIENVLPGGIGTYSISHLPSFGRAVVKPERGAYGGVEETNMERNGEASNTNSNCSSYNGGGGFKLWDESAVKETSTAKFKVGESQMTTETSEKFPSFLSGSSAFGSMASSKHEEKKKGYGFMEMLRRVKGLPEDEDEDDDDFLKKESSSHKDVGVRIEVKGNEQKANTPRSKHSATEQRRRSKINNRFQVLREIIPHSDQKRDKASFLLETIEYVQFLQEKLLKYEAAFPGWNQDSMKFTPRRHHDHGLGESTAEHSRAMKNSSCSGSGLMLAHKFDENNVALTPSMLGNSQNPVESDNTSTGTPYHPSSADKGASVPIPLQKSVSTTTVGRCGEISQPQQSLISDAENMASQSHHHLWQRPCPADTEHEGLAIEGGTIRVSSVYSQGFLSSLSQALQISGIELSRATVSVQIDLGKRASNTPSSTTSSAKDREEPSSCNRTMAHSRVATSGGEDSDRAHKRLKIDGR